MILLSIFFSFVEKSPTQGWAKSPGDVGPQVNYQFQHLPTRSLLIFITTSVKKFGRADLISTEPFLPAL